MLSLQYALELSSSLANLTFDMAINLKLQENFLHRPKTISTVRILIRSLREYLEIGPYQIENIRLPHIPVSDMMELTSLYDLRAGRNPMGFFQNVFTTYKNKIWWPSVGSKEGDRVGCAVICGRQWVAEPLSDLASIYTTEIPAICLALSHANASNGDTFIICVDVVYCLHILSYDRREFAAIPGW